MSQADKPQKTYAVDWDGTLVEYNGYKGPGVYGKPIQAMVNRIKHWIAEGHEVIIFTSRVSDEHGHVRKMQELKTILVALHDMELPPLSVTANKYTRISEFWDDRSVRVTRNEGTVSNEIMGVVQGP